MGARLSLLAPSAPTVALSSYVDILDNMQYIESMSNSRFLKTIKAIDLNNGQAVIIKILIKPNNTVNSFNINLQQYTELLVKEASLLSSYNCFLPNSKVIETDRAGYLIRSLAKTNLYDRLSIRPFLEPIEKKFITFQLLKIMDILHNQLHIRHGDLKLENLLVSSSNWIMLGDFASYLKPVYIPEDNPNQFSFYFDTSDRRVCNLAPERFYRGDNLNPQNFDDSGNFVGSNQISEPMDLFSLGCVIGELYMDGEPLFTLSGLFKYLKNEYVPDLSGIDDPEIKEIVLKLIQFDPNERISVSEVLSVYKNSVFPNTFYTFLYDFLKVLNDNERFQIKANENSLTPSDLRINYIHKNFDKIVHNLKFNYIDHKKPTSMNLNLNGMPKNYNIRTTSNFKNTTESEASALIILNFVFSLVNTLKQPASKIKACELIIALSERVDDACKLDRSLPYLWKMIDNEVAKSGRRYDSFAVAGPTNSGPTTTSFDLGREISSTAIIVALDAIVTLIDSCSYITPLNVSMTAEYLLPKLAKLFNLDFSSKDTELIKIKLASCIPSIAQTSQRFWSMAKTFKINSDKLEDPNNEVRDNLSIPKEALFVIVEDLTSLILTDPNPKVRAGLVTNIEPLCKFFGVDKTNDLILPHLITYLNDPDTELKLCFLDSILFLGPYVGVLSFEQYLLPLLIQTLSDSEQHVVLQVLKIFVNFVSSKLINPATEFNALNIYRELLGNSVHLLVHPNEWIRQSVVNLILVINENLSNADRFCFLYPQIKAYLSYDITTIDWDTLYPCLTKPLTKLVYQVLLNWASTHSDKTFFWKQENFAMTSPTKFTNFSKDLGRSVFVPSNFNGSLSPAKTSLNQSSVPLSHEDKQWLLKLKSVGLDEKDSWKVFNLRSYVSQVSRGMALHGISTHNSFSDLKLVDITPRNVFFDVSYKSEMVANSSKGLTTNVQTESIVSNKTERSDSNSLVLPNIARVNASIQTNQENVFAELETNGDHHHHIVHSNGSNNNASASNNDTATHKVISSNNEKVIISNIKHSYQGSNDYITHYLENVTFDLSLNSFEEFGDPVKKPTSRLVDWQPKGNLVTQINANSNPGIPDSLNCVSVNPTSEFFVTGSEMGLLKIWDTSKLEKNVMFKNASLTASFRAPITNICFMNHRNVIGVTTRDGKLRIFRIDVSRGKTKKIVRYSKLVPIRKYDLQPNEHATYTKFDNDDKLLITTSRCRIISLNVITMEPDFVLHNPLIHGVPTALIIDTKRGWLLVGTNKGILCLWDTRFSVLVKIMKVVCKDQESGTPITQLSLLLQYKPQTGSDTNESQTSYFSVVGGTSETDITVWEMPSLKCREVLCSYTPVPKIKQYSMEEIKSDTGKLTDILQDLTLDLDQDHTQVPFTPAMVTFNHITGFYIVTTVDNGEIILWNLNQLEKSFSTGHANFIRTSINQHQGITNQKQQLTQNDSHHDITNGIGMVSNPYEMIVTIDRSGILTILT